MPASSSASLPARAWPGRFALVAAIALVYLNSLQAPFVFDSIPGILDNPTIRSLADWQAVWSPPHAQGQTVGGRPLVNFTFALDYAVGGTAVWPYHLTNLAIHLAAALLLCGLLRRTLASPRLTSRFGADAAPLAAAGAALWALHPLQTESVTYVIQRAESLMGLCYLATLYTFVRSASARQPLGWQGASVAACFAGMASKEVMVSAPVLVALYDRLFVASSWREIFFRRGRYYFALAASWLLLAWLVFGANRRGGSAGFGTAIAPGDYFLTQLHALVGYVRVVVWPHPLVLDYGSNVTTALAAVAPGAVLVIAAAAWTLRSLMRLAPAGFLGAWVFAILAPTSSVVPIATQTIAEHRLYLPLAAIAAGAVTFGYLRIRRGLLPVAWTIAAVLGLATIRRNSDYASEALLWERTVAAVPQNARAQHNLGFALQHRGDLAGAVAHYEAALRLQPNDAETHLNLANALVAWKESDRALGEFREALRLQPRLQEAHYGLANLLMARGDPRAARVEYEAALRLDPHDAAAHANLANALLQLQLPAESVEAARSALRESPGLTAPRLTQANGLLQLGRTSEAIAEYERVLVAEPANAAAEANLGFARLLLGNAAAAEPHLARAAMLSPNDPEIRCNLGTALAELGRRAEARAAYAGALRLRPDYAEARARLESLGP